MATTPETSYTKGSVTLKKLPKKGENINLFLRPGDELNLGFDLESAQLQLVGSDVIASLPGGGQITFVSLGMMAFEEDAPSIKLPSGQRIDIGDVLNKVQDISVATKDSVLVSGPVSQREDEEKDKKEESSESKQDEAPVNNYNAFFVEQMEDKILRDDFVQKQSVDRFSADSLSLQPVSYQTSSYSVVRTAYQDVVYRPKNDYDAYAKDYEDWMPKNDFDAKKSDYENWMPKNDFTGIGNGNGNGNGPGQVSEAAKPVFYFKTTAHQLPGSEIIDDNGVLNVLGGGGSSDGYTSDAPSAQFQPEIIDKRRDSSDLVIKVENQNYFATDGSTANYLTRVLRFTPQIPEGFFVDSFTFSGLPAEFKLLDENGSEIAGSTIAKEDMIFKDSLGNVISIDDPNFLTTFKTAEVSVKYSTDTIASQFNISIKATYKLDDTYAGTTDLNPTQIFSNDYTIVVKEVTQADDFIYDSKDVGGEDEGFVFATNINGNIIYDGSGNSTIEGGKAGDTIYDGSGSDTISGGLGNDTVYGGSGYNALDGGDGDGDKASYSLMSSYALDEVEVLHTKGNITNDEYARLTGAYDEDGDGDLTDNSVSTQMEAYYNGAYIDLEGFSVPGVDFDGDGTDDTVNVISKFVDKEGFTYDADGLADDTTNTGAYSDLVSVGYDKLSNFENIEGSAYNDWIYGDANSNAISGGGGSDILDGRDGAGDTLQGGNGYDTLYSGSGVDTIDGGADTDTANFQGATQGVEVRLDKPNGEDKDDYALGDADDGDATTANDKDTLVSIEDIIGSDYSDLIVGNGSTNFVQGDVGDDTFMPGGGYDFIDGGTGSDLLTYYRPDYVAQNALNAWEDIQGITVDLNSTDFTMIKETTGGRLIDLVKNVEEINATEGRDVIYGGSAAEAIYTYGGNDRIETRGGNDTVYAGEGDDYIRPGAGLDTVYGGDGVDYLELYDDGLVAGQTLRIDDNGTVQRSTDGGTTWSDGYNANGGINKAYEVESVGLTNSIETVYGNASDNTINGYGGADTINGGDGADTIRGGDGADTINGDNGNDILYGERHNDTINGGDGDDIIYGTAYYAAGEQDIDAIDGGSGTDTVNYSSVGSGHAMTANLVTGSVTFSGTAAGANYTDTLTNIENLVGGQGADNITGSSADNVLNGWSGNDTIRAGDGADTLVYTSGTDALYGENGDDRFELTTVNNSAVIDGGSGTDTLYVNNNLNFSGMADANFERIEVLDVATGRTATLSVDQFNELTTFLGAGNIVANGTAGNDTYDLTGKDFSAFTGKMYLNAGYGTDTLIIGGATTTLTMDYNYFDTFEILQGAAGSTFVVNGDYTTNKNDTMNFLTSNFNLTGVSGDIQVNGGTGNDLYYVDLTNVDKVDFDGGTGTDTVDFRGTVNTGTTTVFGDSTGELDAFDNIETLRVSYMTINGTLEIPADAFDAWDSSDTATTDLTLDVSNATQASRVDIVEGSFESMTNTTADPDVSVPTGDLAINTTYAVDTMDADSDINFNVQVV